MGCIDKVFYIINFNTENEGKSMLKDDKLIKGILDIKKMGINRTIRKAIVYAKHSGLLLSHTTLKDSSCSGS